MAASGIAKVLAYKAETEFGTAPGASGAQLLRRVTSDLNLVKDTYQSGEIRSDYQIVDFRHGTRRINGTISGELSPKTYADFFAAALRKAFAATHADITGLSITVAANGTTMWDITRASGSWITDTVKVGMVLRLAAAGLHVDNAAKNLLVVSLLAASPTIITVVVLNGSAMHAETGITSTTASFPGKRTYVPTTGHTDTSFSIEHWYSDIAQSELYRGCKVSSIDLGLPATGMSTCGITFLGKDITTNTAAYYTNPTALTTTGVCAAVNGVLVANGVPIAIATGMTLRIDGGYTSDPVVGSNSPPSIFPGRVNVTGQITAYFADGTLRDAFKDETAISAIMVLTIDNTATADFLSLAMTHVKFGGATKDDGEKGLVQTMPFQALYDGTGGAASGNEATTIAIQDSAA